MQLFFFYFLLTKVYGYKTHLKVINTCRPATKQKIKPLRMKTKMLAAYMLAAITLSICSCGWFTKKSGTTLTGKWKVTVINDSSVAGIKGNSFFAGFNADSLNFVCSFLADSTLTATSIKQPKGDTAKYYTDAAYHFIYVQGKDSRPDTFPVLLLTDTVLTVVKDSVHITLRRLP